jgi:hypothetical protein
LFKASPWVRKEINHVSRRNQFIAWIAGTATFLGLAYASAPWMLAGWIKAELSDWGLGNIEVRVGYPGWRELKVSQVRFTSIVGGYEFSGELKDIAVDYRVGALLAGNLDRIHVPASQVSAVPATVEVAPTAAPVVQPIAALVSGQWLSELPAREVVFEPLTVKLHATPEAVYSLNLRGTVSETEAQINGDITLPKAQTKPLALSFTANKAGARLALLPSVSTSPMFEWTVNNIATSRDQIEANGQFNAQLHALAPLIKVFIKEAAWLSALEGDVNSTWKAVLPGTGALDEAMLTLDIKGSGASWDGGGKIIVHGVERRREQQLSVEVVKFGGRYKKTALVAMNATAELALDEGPRTTKEARAQVELLDIGFPVKNITAHFELAPHARTRAPVLQVKKLTAELLGGRVRSEPFTWIPGKDTHRIVVELEGIGVNDIMRLEQRQDLHGTGRLDGRIPIEFTREGIHVKQGTLSARPPGGDIRYLPTAKVLALAKTNASIKMVVDALGNFQYHKMDVTSDYKPSGDLVLKVQLAGKNPNWQSGLPVNLNLNVEENIPALLRSLQLSGEISERVRQQYQK